MRAWRVVLTNEAQTDIRNLHDYIAFELLSPESASKQVQNILETIGWLADFPKKFPLCRGAAFAGMELRAVSAGRQRVFYQLGEDIGIVWIIRVLYERRDAANIFIEESP